MKPGFGNIESSFRGLQHLYKSGNFDFANSKWLDEFGRADNAPSLVNSYCLDFNGTTAYVSFIGTWVSNISDVIITACPNGGSWIDYTLVTSPAGLYSISGNNLYVGKNGTNFFYGKIARIQCKNSSGTIIKDIPFSNGYGADIIYGQSVVDSTILVANLENGALLDSNSNGAPDSLSIYTNFTTATTQMINTVENGWSGRHCRIDITTKGGGAYYFQQGVVTPGTLQTGGYMKIKFRTNIISSSAIYVVFSQFGTVTPQYIITTASDLGNICEREFYFKGGNCNQITLFITNSISDGSYFEYDLIQVRKYAGGGIITNATWSATCPVFHANLQFGCDIYKDNTNILYVPFENGVSSNYGGALSFYKTIVLSSNRFTDVETKLQFPNNNLLKLVDSKNYLYTSGGVANTLGYNDIVGAKGDYFFASTFNQVSGITNLMVTRMPLSGNLLKQTVSTRLSDDKRIYVKYEAGSPYYLNIVTPIDSGKYLKRSFFLKTLSTGVNIFAICHDYIISNFTELNALTGTIVKASSDDYCPLNLNGNYIGASHGYSGLSIINVAGHGKTSSDIGSVWNRSGTPWNYKLVKISGNDLSFIMNGTTNNNGSIVPYQTKTLLAGISGVLTHVSGATNTGSINYTTPTYTQILPSSTQTHKVYVDNVEITPGFSGYGKEVKVSIVENVFDFLTFENYYPDNLSNSGNIANRVINYYLTGDNSCRVSESLSILKDGYYASYIGFDQSEGLTSANFSATKHYFYFPGSKPFTKGANNYDFTVLKDLYAGLAEQLTFETNYRETDKNINRNVQIIANNSQKLWGFSHGYLSPRVPSYQTGIKGDWYFYTTKKSYPQFIYEKSLENGFNTNVEVFRSFFKGERIDSATCSYIAKTSTGYRLFIDLHTNVTESFIAVPPEIVGLSISLVEKNNNITIHSTQVISDGVKVSVTNNYGYAVLDLS